MITFRGGINYIPILQMRTLSFKQPTPEPELQIIAHVTHCLSCLMPSLVLDATQSPQPKFHDPSFLTSFGWFTCSEFPSVPTSIPASPASGPGMEISRKAASEFYQSLMSAIYELFTLY